MTGVQTCALPIYFPSAKIVAVDIPSAMRVQADYTVTFGAPKLEMLLSPLARNAGAIEVADIGLVPDALDSKVELSEARDFRKGPNWRPSRAAPL